MFCEGGEFWDAMLNQTNLKNNNNKFYILQLLEDNTSRRYTVWFRWGRGKECVMPAFSPAYVKHVGPISLQYCTDISLMWEWREFKGFDVAI